MDERMGAGTHRPPDVWDRTAPVLAIAATTVTAWALLLVGFVFLADPAPVCPPSGCGFDASSALRAAPFGIAAVAVAWWTVRLGRRLSAGSGGLGRGRVVGVVLLATLAFVAVVLLGSL